MMAAVSLPRFVIEEANRFADEVFRRRSAFNRDKYLDGNELVADRRGFEFEFGLCYLWNLPFPSLIEGSKVDQYDFLLASLNEKKLPLPLKCDAKNSPRLLVNKDQFERKKIDIYLFGAIERASAEPWICFLEVYGWIPKTKIPEVSELFDAAQTASRYYQVPRKALSQHFLWPMPGQIHKGGI